ncbi:MAG TPA: hypothetical protein VF874_17160 [Mycobacterium sp.]
MIDGQDYSKRRKTRSKWRADELVVTSVTHLHADRLRSHELIAERWGIT